MTFRNVWRKTLASTWEQRMWSTWWISAHLRQRHRPQLILRHPANSFTQRSGSLTTTTNPWGNTIRSAMGVISDLFKGSASSTGWSIDWTGRGSQHSPIIRPWTTCWIVKTRTHFQWAEHYTRISPTRIPMVSILAAMGLFLRLDADPTTGFSAARIVPFAAPICGREDDVRSGGEGASPCQWQSRAASPLQRR